MQQIKVCVDNEEVGSLFKEAQANRFVFNYSKDYKPISLIMPYKASSYIWTNRLHPVFDMYIPEGYLFELFRNILAKEYGYVDDYVVFSYICSNIESRLTFKSELKRSEFPIFDLDDILNDDSQDTFSKLVSAFLKKNSLGGVHPKTIALLKSKESFTEKDYILKTWGAEYDQLALNEYFCLKAVEKTGVPIPKILLSSQNKFLLVERFNYDKKNSRYIGFEEILVLLGKNKDEKYSGSYEKIAEVICNVTTDACDSLRNFYKIIVMNYLLKNGDAHLKNFGILYAQDSGNNTKIWLAPAYDVVNTVVYSHKDKPALTMFGKKLWFGKNDLIKFGVNHCNLTESEAAGLYEICIKALKESINDLSDYIKTNPKFSDVGKKMLNVWRLSLDEKTYKEVPLELTRNRPLD